VLFRNYKMDENSRPRKQARLDTFLIPRRGQLQCISSTLYSLTSINCVVTVRGVALWIAEILQTDGRTDGHQVFEQRA
jgi:hypothetical protein